MVMLTKANTTHSEALYDNSLSNLLFDHFSVSTSQLNIKSVHGTRLFTASQGKIIK